MIKNNVYLTPQLKSRLTTKVRYDLDRKLRTVLELFPELEAERIEVGLFTMPFTSMCAKTDMKDRIKLGYHPGYPITYYVLGHELTHFVQHLDEEETGIKIPYGEAQCDVWTIARDELFLDAPPHYLHLSRGVSGNWALCAHQVRRLCIDAINAREKGRRHYLRSLECELLKLTNMQEQKCRE